MNRKHRKIWKQSFKLYYKKTLYRLKKNLAVGQDIVFSATARCPGINGFIQDSCVRIRGDYISAEVCVILSTGIRVRLTGPEISKCLKFPAKGLS